MRRLFEKRHVLAIADTIALASLSANERERRRWALRFAAMLEADDTIRNRGNNKPFNRGEFMLACGVGP